MRTGRPLSGQVVGGLHPKPGTCRADAGLLQADPFDVAVVESTGIADQVGGLTDAVQAPVEDLTAAAEEVTAVVDPLADQI